MALWDTRKVGCGTVCEIMNSLSQHVQNCLPTARIVQEPSARLSQGPIGGFREKVKVVWGIPPGHSCWEKEFNNVEKTLNEEISASGSRA